MFGIFCFLDSAKDITAFHALAGFCHCLETPLFILVKAGNRNSALYEVAHFAGKDRQGPLYAVVYLAKQAITSYLKKWDVWNIKTILRGKRFGASHDEISITLVPAGLLKEDFLKKVIETAKNYEDAIAMFQNTEYAPILRKHKGKPEELEDALDRAYYPSLVSAIPKEIKPFARMQIDVLNALGKARAKDTEMQFTDVKGGSEEGLKAMAGTPEELTTRLTKSLIANGSKMLHDFRMNLRPVIGYFASKENEIRNIRLIARGRHSGLPQETIEKNLVI